MKLDFSQKYAVRPLTAGDVDKILALCAENEQFCTLPSPLATRESVLEDMTALPPGKCAADKHYLGFFDRETLVAVLDLIERYPQDDTTLHQAIYDEKERQGHGLGTALIGELLDELRREKFRKVRLAVDRGNPQSKAFWEKNGFALTGEASARRFWRISCRWNARCKVKENTAVQKISAAVRSYRSAQIRKSNLHRSGGRTAR